MRRVTRTRWCEFWAAKMRGTLARVTKDEITTMGREVTGKLLMSQVATVTADLELSGWELGHGMRPYRGRQTHR